MDRLSPEYLDLLVTGHAKGWLLVETELASDLANLGPLPACLWYRAICLDTNAGQHWAVRFREWQGTNLRGQRDGHQQPVRVEAEARTLRFWVERP